MADRHKELRVPVLGSSLSVAREWLDAEFGWLAPDVLFAAKLLVCEILSNALRHIDSTERDVLGISIGVSAGILHASVSDPGAGFDPADVVPGWGVYLLGRVAARWQVVRRDGRTCVEFDLEVPQPS